MNNSDALQDAQLSPEVSRHRLLVVGVLVGAVLALSGLLQKNALTDSSYVAQVDGSYISLAAYQQYLRRAFAEDGRTANNDERRKILDRLIEQRLLVNRAVEMGLLYSDPMLNKAVRQAMLDSISADMIISEVPDEQLEDFFNTELAYFSRAQRYRLQKFTIAQSAQVSVDEFANGAIEALQSGEKWRAVKDKYASTDLVSLPNQLLPQHKLQQYLGAGITEKAIQLGVGDIGWSRSASGDAVIYQMLEKGSFLAPAFEDVRDLVASEYRRRQSNRAIGEFRARLWRDAEIKINHELL